MNRKLYRYMVNLLAVLVDLQKRLYSPEQSRLKKRCYIN